MEINIIHTGSDGNCSIIYDNKTKIMIDCGINLKIIKSKINNTLDEIEGILITHEHQDHVKSINKLLNMGINIYIAKETAEALKIDINNYYVNVIESKKVFNIGTYQIMPFDLIHISPNGNDCKTIGFLIKSKNIGEKLVWCTDTQFIPYEFEPCEYYCVECNYDSQEKFDPKYDNMFVDKRRYRSHQSLRTCIEWLKKQNLSKCISIYLLHVSDKSDKKYMKTCVEQEIKKHIII